MSYPLIIQGGMGVGISGWRLAKAVSELGQLGVVSGTGIDSVFVRLLQKGDPGGYLQEALKHFPVPEIASRIFKKYFSASDNSGQVPFKGPGMLNANPSREQQELLVVSNFVEVCLAKLNHGGQIGINYLEKLQVTTLPSLYGALLAGVDYVLMGAGIPREIPGALDALAEHKEASLKLNVVGATKEDDYKTGFSPREVLGNLTKALKRPKFFPIISSTLLAKTLVRKSTGKVDGFIVEAPSAGGHNAPPRGDFVKNERGEPVYGERDEVDLVAVKKLNLPFWLAGSSGSSEGLKKAISKGATGIQVGTAFALCNESGLRQDLKDRMLSMIDSDKVDVFTDPLASPTGFPFKVARLEGTLSEKEVYGDRNRICDAGYLRQLYKKEDGSIGYRCPSEPVHNYLKKGGHLEDTVGRKCLCNALMANIGLPQRRKGYIEQALVTIGDCVNSLKCYMKKGSLNYSARDVVRNILD